MSQSRLKGNTRTQTNGSRLPSRKQTPQARVELLDSPNGRARDSSHKELSACLAETRGKMLAWSRDFDALLRELVENPEDAMIGQLVIPQSKTSVRLQTLERYLPTFLRLNGAIHAYVELELKAFGGGSESGQPGSS